VKSLREIAMKKTMDLIAGKDARKFEVECRAGGAGELRVGSESVCVKVGQRVRTDGIEKIWHSVGVYAKQDETGNLVIRVLVFHPDWDEALQIACIKSRPGDVECETALGCNLDHVAP
jgi:hypothetical protein